MFNVDDEHIEFLGTKTNRSEYIRELIDKAMRREKGELTEREKIEKKIEEIKSET